MSTMFSPETKLSRTLNKIQYCSSKGYSLKENYNKKCKIGSTWVYFLS
ncbi:hypothetical protein H7686_0002540 [Candidatus Phytoplasma asiaticum]|uniref:Uncharacterized protein n=1 Tax=Candidatus Phytoplasma asiaticum TaxID=2763338 RepID=A0AAX3B9I2_9MOLU|nr:hypothetical protein H7686_0002540 ['Parthenium hysterophorus' phyllody phytoplasma]